MNFFMTKQLKMANGNKDNNIINRLRVLSFGTNLSDIELVCLGDNEVTRKTVSVSKDEGSDSRVLVVEIASETCAVKQLIEIIENYVTNDLKGYFFVMKKKDHLRVIIEAIGSLSLGEPHIYGVDPGYYYSIVPLSGNNHKAVEAYVSALKSERGFKAAIKALIKKTLITFGCSHKLYEEFVVIVSGEKNSSSGRSGHPC